MMEGYNSVHDVCRLLIGAAVGIAARKYKRALLQITTFRWWDFLRAWLAPRPAKSLSTSTPPPWKENCKQRGIIPNFRWKWKKQ